jgi:methionyl aminopeptidase
MSIQSEQDLTALRRVGHVVALTLAGMRRSLRPGMTTLELDAVGWAVLKEHGAYPAPQQHYGFPGVTCISLNDEAVHGIPALRTIREGDLVKLDVTAELGGYIADAAITVAVPPVSPLKQRLCDCAEAAFRRAAVVAQAGRRIREVGREVEREVRRRGFAVVRELSGHGVGRAIHEPPTVPNYHERRCRDRLTEGLVLTIEPIIASGSGSVVQEADGWTVRTRDGSLAAHHEHTLVITKGQPLLLTELANAAGDPAGLPSN